MTSSPLSVLPLEVAKAHLQENVDEDDIDEELIPVIGAAVERVERHLGLAAGTLRDATWSQQMAAKVVLADYWATQRTKIATTGYGGGPVSDDRPLGNAPMDKRLEELLGPAVDAGSGGPVGSFPVVQAWPDPPYVVTRPRW